MKLKYNFKYLFLIFTLFFLLNLIPYKTCQAASATVTISSEDTTVTKGDEILVSLKVTSEDVLGDFVGYLSYNADILEFQNEGSFVAGGDGLLKVTDINTAEGETSRKYVFKFIAKDLGTSEVKLKEKSEIYDFETGQLMSVSSNALKITVAATQEASDNSDLKELKINPGTLTPEFNKDITAYTVNVNAKTDSLVISSLAEDDKAIVTIDGNQDFLSGENTVKISVKAESGNQKDYILTVNKAEEEKESTENDSQVIDNNSEDNPNKNLAEINNIQVLKIGEDSYLQNAFRYKLISPDETVTIPKGYEKSTILIDGTSVVVYQLASDEKNEFLLFYGENEMGDRGFYQYDRKEHTIQRFVAQDTLDSGKVVVTKDVISSEDYKTRITVLGIVCGILGGICILLSIILVKVKSK